MTELIRVATPTKIRTAILNKVRNDLIAERAKHTLTEEAPDFLYGTISPVVTALFENAAKYTTIDPDEIFALIPRAAQLTNNLHLERARVTELSRAFFDTTVAGFLDTIGQTEAGAKLRRSGGMISPIIDTLDRTCAYILDNHILHPDDAIYFLRMGPAPIIFYMQQPNNAYSRTHLGRVIASYLVHLAGFATRVQDSTRRAAFLGLISKSLQEYLDAMASVKISPVALRALPSSNMNAAAGVA